MLGTDLSKEYLFAHLNKHKRTVDQELQTDLIVDSQRSPAVFSYQLTIILRNARP